jgi:hypothetical protein
MGWIVLWTVRMMTCPARGRGCASFCLSWPSNADDPGVRKAAQPVFVGNRNMNWVGMSTIRSTSGCRLNSELSASERAIARRDADKSAQGTQTMARTLLLRGS